MVARTRDVEPEMLGAELQRQRLEELSVSRRARDVVRNLSRRTVSFGSTVSPYASPASVPARAALYLHLLGDGPSRALPEALGAPWHHGRCGVHWGGVLACPTYRSRCSCTARGKASGLLTRNASTADARAPDQRRRPERCGAGQRFLRCSSSHVPPACAAPAPPVASPASGSNAFLAAPSSVTFAAEQLGGSALVVMSSDDDAGGGGGTQMVCGGRDALAPLVAPLFTPHPRAASSSSSMYTIPHPSSSLPFIYRPAVAAPAPPPVRPAA